MEYLPGVGLVLKAIEWLARLSSLFTTHYHERLEEQILEYVAAKRDWVSPRLVWADAYLKRVLEDVPISVLYPQPEPRGWEKLGWKIKNVTILVRHYWRKWLHLVPQHRIEKTMRGLWRQGLLERATFGGEFYRVKASTNEDRGRAEILGKGETMSRARRIVLASYCLGFALAFIWVPWTHDVGYSWLWSKPKPLEPYDIVAEARQRWEEGGEATRRLKALSELEELFGAMQNAPEEKKSEARQKARETIKTDRAQRTLALLKKQELQRMSDKQILDWLTEKQSFDYTFPEKAQLSADERLRVLDEWEKTVPSAKEWNERVLRARIDYQRIGMEIVALTALLGVGLVLTSRPKLKP